MNGEYYRSVSRVPGVETIWGMPSEVFLVAFLLILVSMACIFSTWEWWKLKIYVWSLGRNRKKKLKSGKGKIKSFIIEVAGRELTQKKFERITGDINAILEGKMLAGVANKDIGKELDSNNIVGITDVPGVISHFFVIWYREV